MPVFRFSINYEFPSFKCAKSCQIWITKEGGDALATGQGMAGAGQSIFNTFVFLWLALASQDHIQWPGQNQKRASYVQLSVI